jgi:hypothetical protein
MADSLPLDLATPSLAAKPEHCSTNRHITHFYLKKDWAFLASFSDFIFHQFS